ncbi:MAG TPA: hypothetical protein PLJ60_03955 [Chryseolinea sp.]|nr:hypothetical protein [Chryseolinea sp.]HPM29470.1 hypothetical protein [Chryseolinea sp.]
MKFRIFITFAIVASSLVQSVAQKFPSELWHEGKIVLLEGADTLVGSIKYDLQQDLIQYTTSNQTIETYSAKKVLFFEIFDETVHKYRAFYALPYSTQSGYRAPIFFELLEEGKLTLLVREAIENKSYSSTYYYGSYTRQVLVYRYFFLDENGVINEFTGNKKDLLELMGKKAEAVEDFIKANRLKLDEKYDFAQIVKYYNSLFGT